MSTPGNQSFEINASGRQPEAVVNAVQGRLAVMHSGAENVAAAAGRAADRQLRLGQVAAVDRVQVAHAAPRASVAPSAQKPVSVAHDPRLIAQAEAAPASDLLRIINA